MNNEIIKLKVLARAWTFSEISNLKQTIDSLSNEIYNESKLSERFNLIREIKINEGFVGHTFEDVMRSAIKTKLSGEIAGVIRIMLNTATVDFGGNENEISEGSMGGEPHKERTTDEKKSSLIEE
tara:strand:- start:4400 stop:4774 length:375 start_codon:yes stop_codon:yes gene_type:complete